MIYSTATAIRVAVDDGDPPLVYRGTVSVGRFAIEDQFVVGPAVDEAAQAEKLAQGALVWCCPSALDCISKAQAAPLLFAGNFENLPLVQNYPVHLKGGDTIVSHVINPLSGNHERFIQRTLDGFDSLRIDVRVKKQNTETFLRRAEAEAREYERRLLALLVQAQQNSAQTNKIR